MAKRPLNQKFFSLDRGMAKRPPLQKFLSLDRGIAQIEFNKSIAGCYHDGNAEYDSVGVLLLTWRDDDLNCKEKEVNALEKVFKEKFNFRTEQYEIPPTGSDQALFSRMQAFTRCYDGPSKLGIIYYGGHAERKETKEGIDLELFARRSQHGVDKKIITNLSELSDSDLPTDIEGTISISISDKRIKQPRISFKAVCEQIKNSETDILLIVDSCFAAGAFAGQPFGGRKCELFCSIAEQDWARAPSQEGSFTKILTTTLEKMIRQDPEGFSTSDLYREIYQQQHPTRKPLYFIQSRYDFGRIWLRPCQPKDKITTALDDSKYTIDVRFHLTKSPDIAELNKVVKALQWIPYVQMVNMQNMHGPNDDLSKFIRTVHLANRLRPLLTRVRSKIELKRARKLCKTNSSPSSSAMTSERYHVTEPRDVGLFDYSKAQAVTPYDERFTLDEYFHLEEKPQPKLSDSVAATKIPGYPNIADMALQIFSRKVRAGTPVRSCGTHMHWFSDVRLSQRALDGLLFFTMGILAPNVLRWAVQGNASMLAAL